MSHSIYVIELDPIVMNDKKFANANPNYRSGSKCFYVGMTGKSPEERFEQHKRGYKSNRYVKKFGIALRPRYYSHHNPMTYEEAQYMEVEKARRLRNRGYGVWQH